MSSKLDPDLLRVARRHAVRTATAAPEAVSLVVSFTGPVDDLIGIGFEPHTVLRDPAAATIATGVLPADAVALLEDIDHVEQAEGAHPSSPLLTFSLPAANIEALHTAPHNLRGSGIVVGVIDNEIDIFHESFRTSAGTRILALWNQKEVRPAGYNNARTPYGVEYLRTDIDNFLTHPDQARTVANANRPNALGGTRRNARTNHGTPVAGIAAGNGRPDGGACSWLGSDPGDRYVGAAPEADLVVVARRTDTPLPAGTDAVVEAPKTPEIIDALNYIFTHPDVGTRPVVVNISLGVRRGPRDGTALLERAVDMVLQNGQAPGRAVVVAAGNEATRREHASGTLTARGNTSLSFGLAFTKSGTELITSTEQRLQLWFDTATNSGTTPVRVGLRARNPDVVIGALDVPGQANARVDQTNVGMQTLRYGNKVCVDITWSRADTAWKRRTWTLDLVSHSDEDIFYDAWFEFPYGNFSGNRADPSRTATVPATAASAIAVGGYMHLEDKIVASSSNGPTRGGKPVPDVVAPGELIWTAKGANAYHERLVVNQVQRCCGCCAYYEPVTAVTDSEYAGLDAGTSFAAPHVTGLVALMFQVKPDLTTAEVRQILHDTAEAPEGVTASPADPPYGQWGWGMIDGVAAIDEVKRRRGAGRAPRTGAATSGRGRLPRPGTGDHAILSSMFGAVHRDRVSDPAGARWAALVSRHFSEVRGLITHQRRVALYWHRLGGPALVRTVVDELAARPPSVRAPAPDTDRFASYLGRFLAELDRRGSAGLRRDVRRYRQLLGVATPATVQSAPADIATAE